MLKLEAAAEIDWRKRCIGGRCLSWMKDAMKSELQPASGELIAARMSADLYAWVPSAGINACHGGHARN